MVAVSSDTTVTIISCRWKGVMIPRLQVNEPLGLAGQPVPLTEMETILSVERMSSRSVTLRASEGPILSTTILYVKGSPALAVASPSLAMVRSALAVTAKAND